jgi:hypothetical protein
LLTVRQAKRRLGQTRLWRLIQEFLVWRRAHDKSSDPANSALLRQVEKTIAFPTLPLRRRVRGSVWAVGMVKNEADIIVPVVENLFRQGVKGVLIADNCSTDETPALLASLADSHPLYLAYDREVAYLQEIKMNLLCDWARRAGADWIIPFDADEFWFATEGTLGDFLGLCKADIAQAAMHNLFPASGVRFGEGPWRLEVTAHPTHAKVAFRSHRHALLAMGNHRVSRPGRTIGGLRVVHVPWRSYDQFRLKGTQGLEALSRTSLDPGKCRHWRYLGALSDDEAREVWRKILDGESVSEIFWSPTGASKPVDPTAWVTWDPDHELAETL